MKKKLLFLMIGACLLTGCGASTSDMAPAETCPAGAVPEVALDQSCYSSATGGGTEPCAATEPGEGEFYGMVGGTGYETPSAPEDGTADFKTNYFTFSRGSEISFADDGTELLYEYTCDTDFTSVDAQLQEWVDSVLAGIRGEYASNSANLLRYARDSLDFGDAESFYSYSNYQELGIARHDSKVVSLVVLSSVYAGGTHPNTVQTAWNLDMENRRVLTLQDLIYPESAKALGQLVLERVKEKFQTIDEGVLFDDYEATITRAFDAQNMTPYWYLNDKGLVIFFNQYTLGPYAAGIIKTELPYQALDGILREEYFPGNYGLLPGDLLILGDWAGHCRIPVTLETAGERLLIGVEGEVYQVQLSEISWLEGTAIGQKMLFSANCLTENDVIELIARYDDESCSLAVEFIDGQGNATIYYIHPEGLSAEPAA